MNKLGSIARHSSVVPYIASSNETQTCCSLVNVNELTRAILKRNDHQFNHSHPHVYQSWKCYQDQSSTFWDNRPDMLIFAFFTRVQKRAKISPELLHRTSPNCIRCSHVQCASKLPIDVPIFQSVLECQRDNEDWSAKNVDFATLIGCDGNVPWAIAK